MLVVLTGPTRQNMPEPLAPSSTAHAHVRNEIERLGASGAYRSLIDANDALIRSADLNIGREIAVARTAIHSGLMAHWAEAQRVALIGIDVKHFGQSFSVGSAGGASSSRFIELMPTGDNLHLSERFLSTDSVLRRLEGIGDLHPAPGPLGNGPATYFQFEGAPGTVGVITPLSHNYCDRCNRMRLTAVRLAFSELGFEGDDLEMRQRIEDLIQEQTELGSFLESPPPGVDATSDKGRRDYAGRVRYQDLDLSKYL